MEKFDIQKAYESGVTSLLMGGEIVNNCIFREKDVLADDYSMPFLSGKPQIVSKQECETYFSGTKKVILLRFQNNARLFLTKEEYEAGRREDC